MDIVFVVAGHVVIDNVVDVVYIDAARRHIRRNQQRYARGFEGIHHARALALVQIAVQRLRQKAVAAQVLRYLLDHELGIAEDHAQPRLIGAQNQVQRIQLAPHRHVNIGLADVLKRHLLAVDLDDVRLGEVGFGDFQNGGRHRGGKEHRLTGLGHVLQDGLNVLAEAHGEHFIRLVEHDQLHVVQLQRAAAHVIHHAPGRADNQITLSQPRDLPVHRRAAVDVRDPDVGHEARQLFDLVAALLRQLARGAQDQRLYGGLGLAAVDFFNGGNGEGQRLACAGLGFADDVAPLADAGDRLGLNIGGAVKAHFIDRALHFGDEPKLGKLHFTHIISRFKFDKKII